VERGVHLKPDERPFDQTRHTSHKIPTFYYGPCDANLTGRRIWRRMPGTPRQWPASAPNRRLQPLETLPFASDRYMSHVFRFRRRKA
jgi:hypothetical protein